ncbi:MAG: DUF4838 domain-containing protein [Bacteroidales bacterium]|nr:DUF4838 domain-containing protein [Bacteroidales bacterium]
MKRINYLILTIAAVFCTSCASNRKDVSLVSHGETKYHIVVSDKATDNEIYAAQLMQEYIYKISGAKVPIVNKCRNRHKEEIHIGTTPVKDFTIKDKNTVGVKRFNQTLVFNCEDDLYTMYSVIDFLEKYLHVRRFTKNCEYHPIGGDIILRDFDGYTYKTPNSFREVRGTFVRKDKDMCRWLKNTLAEDYFANGFFVHTAKKLLDDKEYFETHPEYFALLESNQRSRDQVCWSNDEVFEIMKTNLRNQMMLQPDKQLWSVSQEDNYTYCHCEKCMSVINQYKSPSAPIILFVNKMAKAFPDKTISTLAYQYSRKCPEGLKPENNVQIMLCTIEADRNKTIEEQGKGEGSFAYDLKQWGKVTNNIFLWDYDVDFAYYLCPFPNLHVLQPNIQFFVNNNAFEHFQQSNSDTGHELSELKTYLISQLLWNPQINADKVTEEFCDAYYGPASPYIQMYIGFLEQAAKKAKDSVVLDIYGSPVRYKDNILSDFNLSVCNDLFNKAEFACSEDSISLIRVRIARLALQYACMEIAKTDMYGERGWFTTNNGRWQVKGDMIDMLEQFYNTCNVAQVRDINESGLTPHEYYAATKRIITNDVSGNIAFKKKVYANVNPSVLYSSGDIQVMTDGVKGSDDYKMLWLGWQGKDFTLDVDLDTTVYDKQISISTLNVPKSWILHPFSVECLVSSDGKNFHSLGKQDADGYNKHNPTIKEYTFTCKDSFRYIKFIVNATKTLPQWHPSYTQPSWVFADEITVK